MIKEKRRRSSRWVSSSIPEDRWDTDLAQFSSADYHVNNLVSPVLFQVTFTLRHAGTPTLKREVESSTFTGMLILIHTHTRCP